MENVPVSIPYHDVFTFEIGFLQLELEAHEAD